MAFPPAQPPAGAMMPPQGTPSAAGAPNAPQGLQRLPRPALEMSPADVKLWWKRIGEDQARRKQEEPKWRMLYNAYLPPSYGADYTDLNSNIHFRNVHLKQSELFTQFPTLILTPSMPLRGIPQIDPHTGQPAIDPKTNQPTMASPDDIVAINAAILNKLLGRDGANVGLTVKQCLFDYEQTSGIGPSKICYESDVKYIAPDAPAQVPGAILGLSQPPAQQPVVVNERFKWFHFSAEQLGIPSTWRSTDWDNAPYLFMEFETPFTEQSKRAYNLPADFKPTTASVDKSLNTPTDNASKNSQQVIKGVEVWLHAADFDPNEADKDVFYRLVLIQGLTDKAAVYELSPYQDKDLNGRLTTDSMLGNPIHPMCLRVAGDTAYVPSDAAFTNPLVNIENIQEKRDALIAESNIPRFLHATSLTAAIDKMRNAGTGQGVAIDDALMLRGVDKLIGELPHLERAQADVAGREHNRTAITETLGLGANQAGAVNTTKKSATEIATVQANVSTRLQSERVELLEWVLRGVRKMDALKMRYMTEPGYVQIVGENGFQKLAAYTAAHLSPRFSYDAYPDSQLTLDQATRIRRATDYINFLAKSPAVNQVSLARLATNEFGYAASEMLQTPPTPPPPAPSGSLAIKAEDLGVPEFRAMLCILYPELKPALLGPISPQALAATQAAQQPAAHGGAQPKSEKVSEHAAAESGNQKGPPPLGAVPPAHPVPQAEMAH